MKSHDVQIVSKPGIAGSGGGEGGETGAPGPDGGRLGGGNTSSTETEGVNSCGGVDLRGVTDGAVAPGSSDADIIVLAGQMVLA